MESEWFEGRILRAGQEYTGTDSDGSNNDVWVQDVGCIRSNGFLPIPRDVLKAKGYAVSDLGRGKKLRLHFSYEGSDFGRVDDISIGSVTRAWEKAVFEIQVVGARIRAKIKDSFDI